MAVTPDMSVPPASSPASLSTSGYEDGLGRRTLIFDRETGGILERLQLRPELAAFERVIRERVEQSAAFEDERFTNARSVERDSRSGAVLIVSEFVPGNRLSDVLEALSVDVAEDATGPGLDAALGFLLEVLPALAAFHAATGFTHGAVGPGRTVVTPAGQVVLLDWMFAHALERLELNRHRLWRELGIAMPVTPGASRFDGRSDVAQAALTAVMIVIGRLLRVDEYPDGLTAVVSEVVDIAQIQGSARFATGLQRFLHHALPLPGSRPFLSAEEADTALRQLASEIGVSRCRTALSAFVSEFNRVREIESEETDWQRQAGDLEAAADTGQSATLLVDTTEAARSVSAAMEFEISLDDVLSPGGASQEEGDRDVEPVSYEISLLPVLDDEAALLTFDADHVPALRARPEPVRAPPVLEPALFSPSPVEAGPFSPPHDLPPTHLVATEPAPFISSESLHQNAETPIRVDVPVPALVEELLVTPPLVAHASAPAVDVPQVPPPAVSPSAPATDSTTRQRRRGARRDRDKLRSNAKPADVPAAPVPRRVPAPPAPPPAPAAMPYYPPVFDSSEPAPAATAPWIFDVPTPVVAPPVVRPKPSSPPAPVRVKSEAPAGYAPPARRGEHHESNVISALPYVNRGATPKVSSVHWKLGAAAALVLAVGAGAVARPYLTSRSQPQVVPVAAPAPAPTQKVASAPAAGSLVLVTQPAGARVLLDGAPAGETPLTIESVAPGRHTVTFVTASGSVRKNVRVEAGKAASLDVPVYSGWIAVFTPVLLDIAEGGRSIGNSEQGRLMLSPGRHQLTFSNRDLGYTSSQTVDIEPGEERSLNVQATGELNLNALPWAEVWIDGQKTGDTPIANLRVPLGTHEIVFKHPQFPDRTLTTTVRANAPTAAAVDFTKTP